jgi:Reverse transcriptase (RNA-dependent DNA polymerase)
MGMEESEINKDNEEDQSRRKKEEKGIEKPMTRNIKRRKQAEFLIGTLNVVTLNGKVEEILDVMKERKLNILGLSECKWRGNGEKHLRDGYKLWWSGGSEGRNGVGIIVDKNLKDFVTNVVYQSDRIMKVVLKINSWMSLELIQIYAPQTGRPVKEKEDFEEELERTMLTANTQLVMGDFNAKIGKDQSGYEEVMGKFGFGNKNREGGKMLDLCLRNSFLVGNSCFKKRKSQQVTRYGYGEDMHESVIDYICVTRDLRRHLIDVWVCPSVSVGSDHRLLVGKFRIKPQKPVQKSGNNRLKIWRLQEIAIRNNFKQMVQEGFQKDQIQGVEEEWCFFKSILVDAVEKLCGRASGRRKNKETRWWNDRVRAAVKEKNKTWQESIIMRSTENEGKYKQSKQDVFNIVTEEKKKAMQELASKLEKDFDGNKKLIYGLIKGKREIREDVICMKDKNGELTVNPNDVLKIWSNYFEKLLNVDTNDEDSDGNEKCVEEEQNDKDEEDEVSEAEVERALRGMRNGRSPGIDEVTVEMIKAAGEIGTKWLHRIILNVWKNKKIPEDWRMGIIVPIFKKGDRKSCNNYRGVTLMCQCAKVYEKIIEFRLKECVEESLREEQCGFRAGRGSIDAIFTIRQIMERRWESGDIMHMVFIDLEKAYDRLPRKKVWECLRKRNVSRGLISRIRSTYEKNTSCVQTAVGRSEWFSVREGVRQGSVLSPSLFIIVMDELLRAVEENEDADSRTLVYADDVIIWGESREEIQEKVNKWKVETEKMGLKISQEKSEVMTMERKKTPRNRVGIRLQEKELKETDMFKYLGSVITKKATIEEEVKQRIRKAEIFYQSVRKLLWNEDFPTKCKLIMFKMYFLPILMYGAVTWSIGGKEERQLQAAEMKFLRSVKGVTKIDKVKSTKIRKELGVERLGFKLGRERLKWFGNMKRMPMKRIPRREFENTVEGRRRVGRPRAKWNGLIKEDLEERKSNWNEMEAKKLWGDKKAWKVLIEKCEEEEENEEI